MRRRRHAAQFSPTAHKARAQSAAAERCPAKPTRQANKQHAACLQEQLQGNERHFLREGL
jgi:hypothetical protein